MVDLPDVIALSKLPELLPRKANGNRVAKSTVYRWTTTGLRGVTLNYTQVGGVRYVTRADLDEFFLKLKGPKALRLLEDQRRESNRKVGERLAEEAGLRLKAKYFGKKDAMRARKEVA